MQISKTNKCVVLRLRDPNRVLAVIPTAKQFIHEGIDYVAVPHRPDETKVLRNLGIDAPSPILYHYAWPGQFPPFDAQREAAAFMSLENRAFNLSDLGTGKTLATLWAYDYLRTTGAVKKMLVITPLSTLERTWADEVFQHFPDLEVAVLHGSRKRRLDLLSCDADVYLINHDGVKVSGFVEALKNRNDIDLVVIDEIAQVGRNAGTDRFKALAAICNKQTPRKVWGLTGTPTPNAPTDAWAQCRLLVPERVPPYFNRFKEQVMRQVSPFLWVPRPNAIETVHEVMQPAVRFTRDECLDLPPVMFQTRAAPLTKEQEKAYKQMLTQLRIEAAAGDITAANEAVKAQKLIQVACGLVYGANGVNEVMDVGPRMDVLMEVIEESASKTIVFVPFVAVAERVAKEVSERSQVPLLDSHGDGNLVELIHGGVSKSERDRIFSAFQDGTKTKVLVAQPAAMSHGLTLTAASTIVWFAPITSNEVFTQANGRITRAGQIHNQLIVTIEGTDIEKKYYKRLREKQKVQGVLLDMVKDSREELV
jgi:SNF2 family DNA or RNA helicase